ncbi:MAG: ParB/Srx family N-terminal domain-containing protein [Thermodesulfobacteriota bacterium]
MNIKPLYQKIPQNQIDLEDLTFNLAPVGREEISAQLRDSVSRCGIIHPPLLTPKDHGKFTIVAGRQRLIAARQVLATDFCDCLILPTATPPTILLTVALQDILCSRPASPLEKAICWQKAVGFLGQDIAEEEFGPQLELTRQLNPARLEKILTLADKMQESLHQGTLDLKTTFKLLDLDQADRDTLFKIIKQLRLSSSNQRKLVDYCLELFRRQNRQIAALLSEPECLEIINHLEANPPQKTAMLMNWLTGQCYPRLTEAEKEFRSFVGQLKLPKGVTLEHTPSFEKDTLKMTIDFKNQRQLTEKWPLIRRAIVDVKG